MLAVLLLLWQFLIIYILFALDKNRIEKWVGMVHRAHVPIQVEMKTYRIELEALR